jgi:oxalate decarboxylase/phosphoglucose isomerase-like protein (cupin superfamily)
MTIVATGERARTMDFEAGDVGYIEKRLPRYIRNIGDQDLLAAFARRAYSAECGYFLSPGATGGALDRFGLFRVKTVE